MVTLQLYKLYAFTSNTSVFCFFYLPEFETWSALAQMANWASFPRFPAVFPAESLTLIIRPSARRLLESVPSFQASSTVILPPVYQIYILVSDIMIILDIIT